MTSRVFTVDELNVLTAGPMGRFAGRSAESLEAEAVACLMGWARCTERRLRELRMATPEEVHAIRCSLHGWPPCPSGDGQTYPRGCLERQATVMSSRVWESDASSSTAWSKTGVIGDTACEAAAPSA